MLDMYKYICLGLNFSKRSEVIVHMYTLKGRGLVEGSFGDAHIISLLDLFYFSVVEQFSGHPVLFSALLVQCSCTSLTVGN